MKKINVQAHLLGRNSFTQAGSFYPYKKINDLRRSGGVKTEWNSWHRSKRGYALKIDTSCHVHPISTSAPSGTPCGIQQFRLRES
jgi:hypothetical protein